MKLLTILALTFGSIAALGCNEIGGINEPIPKDGVGGNTPATSGTTPGTTPPAGGGDTSRFVGAWNGGGTVTFSKCDDARLNGPIDTSPSSFSFANSSRGIQMTGGDCNAEFAVSGNVATAVDKERTCTINADSIAVDLLYTSATFTLASNGSGALAAAGKAQFYDATGGSAHCEFSQQETYTRGGS